jgi:mono/diheme cytochrome c family protein
MISAQRVVFAVAALTAGPAAAQDAAIQRGDQVFQYWCAPCHAPGPKHPGTQALEALYRGEKPAALEERSDLVPALTQTFVRSGVSIMPPFRKTEISDADLAALAAYLAPRSR